MGVSPSGSYQCITFLTDYGLEDGFVAACHGVMARLAPGVPVIDITHLVPPGDVRRGAAVLAQTVPYLPAGVHVAVVDPGVGTARRTAAIEAGDNIFVGPDNGLLSWATNAAGGVVRAHELANQDLWLRPVSRTFHGRDVFAPVAARLATGLDLAAVGPAIPPDRLVTIPEPTSRVRDGCAEGEVLSADRFGNVQLSVREAQLAELGVEFGDTLAVELARRTLTVPLRETFASVPPGELVAYVDSAGFVAVAVNSGNASQRLGLPPGARVRLARTAAAP